MTLGQARNDKRGRSWNDFGVFLSLRGTKQSLDVILMDCFATPGMTLGQALNDKRGRSWNNLGVFLSLRGTKQSPLEI
jgi:hypothetical protein